MTKAQGQAKTSTSYSTQGHPLQEHPVLNALLARGDRALNATKISGYIRRSADPQTIQVYPKLDDLSHHIELKSADVLHVQPSSTTNLSAPADIWIDRTANVKFVSQATNLADAFKVASSTPRSPFLQTIMRRNQKVLAGPSFVGLDGSSMSLSYTPEGTLLGATGIGPDNVRRSFSLDTSVVVDPKVFRHPGALGTTFHKTYLIANVNFAENENTVITFGASIEFVTRKILLWCQAGSVVLTSTLDFINCPYDQPAKIERKVSFSGVDYLFEYGTYDPISHLSTLAFDFPRTFPDYVKRISFFDPILIPVRENLTSTALLKAASAGLSPAECFEAFVKLNVSKGAWGKIGRSVIWGVFGAAGAYVCFAVGVFTAGTGLLPCVIAGGASAFDANMLSEIFTDWIGGDGGGPAAGPAGAQGPGPGGGTPTPPKKEVEENQ